MERNRKKILEVKKLEIISNEKELENFRKRLEAKYRDPYRKCKINGETVQKMSCMFCPYGHLLSCHYPYTCGQVGCYNEKGEKVKTVETNQDGQFVDWEGNIID